MLNSSQVPDFILAAYMDAGMLKYLYFVLLLCLYVVTVGANLLLLLVICVNRSLHEPMYLFLCSLFVNEVYGSTGLLPFLLLHILSDTHTVPAALCFLHIFCIYSYGSVEFTNLAVMSYDRYLAICCPLEYHRRMTGQRVIYLFAVIWLPPILAVSITTSLSASLQLCGKVINKVYCDNHSIIKLACTDTVLNNSYELAAIVFTVFAPVSVMAFTYTKIIRVCFSVSAEARQKALGTCWPHLASLINFSCGVCFEIIQSRFDMSSLPSMLRIFLSLFFIMCQPLFNPLIYGLKISKISISCKGLMLRAAEKLRLTSPSNTPNVNQLTCVRVVL